MAKATSSKKHSSKKDSSSSSSSKHSSKHKSSGSGKNTKEMLLARDSIMKKVGSKPKHYTSRSIITSLRKAGKDFSGEIIRAAIAGLQESEQIRFEAKDMGRGKKQQHVMVAISRKAA